MPIRQHVCLFGTTIPWYGICVGIALLVIGIWMIHNFKLFKMNGDEQNAILFRFPFMILFGVLVAFGLDALFTGDWKTWSGPMEGRRVGFTFTGWLLGVIVFLLVFGGRAPFGRGFLLNMFLPIFALTQAIGRVGCFLSGCCYGIPCNCGVRYPAGSLPHSFVGNTSLLPVQLYEACALALLFLVCISLAFRVRAAVYLFGVGVIRFMAEFFRYDHRGDFFGLSVLSPQQCMSVLFVMMGVCILLVELHRPESCWSCGKSLDDEGSQLR